MDVDRKIRQDIYAMLRRIIQAGGSKKSCAMDNEIEPLRIAPRRGNGVRAGKKKAGARRPRVSNMKAGVKKKRKPRKGGANPWMVFLKKYRAEHKSTSDQKGLIKKAAEAYKKGGKMKMKRKGKGLRAY